MHSVASDAQKRANEKYKKESVVRKVVQFYPTDSDLLAWVESRGNVQGYIKQLIREDMERNHEA